jgi:hypothetical protein
MEGVYCFNIIECKPVQNEIKSDFDKSMSDFINTNLITTKFVIGDCESALKFDPAPASV